MRWTADQKGAKILRDRFGDPPSGGQGFEIWAMEIRDYIDGHPEPVPEYGRQYLLEKGSGSRVGTYIGPVPDAEERWVFRMDEMVSGDRQLFEEHGRETILDDYELWQEDQAAEAEALADDLTEADEGIAPDLVTLDDYAGPITDALVTAEHPALSTRPPMPPETDR